MGLETELSRNSIKISGEIMKYIATKIYEIEISKLIEYIVARKDNFQLMEMKNNLINDCKIMGNNCDILFYNNKLALTTNQWCSHIEIWSNYNINVEMNISSKYLFRQTTMAKKSIADIIENEKIICISVNYLHNYIVNGTGSATGLRHAALIKVLNFILPNEQWNVGTYTDIWSNVMKRKSDIEDAYNQKSINGLVFFKEEYKTIFEKSNKEDDRCHIIAFKSDWVEKSLDSKFTNILLEHIANNKTMESVLEII